MINSTIARYVLMLSTAAGHLQCQRDLHTGHVQLAFAVRDTVYRKHMLLTASFSNSVCIMTASVQTPDHQTHW
jgi:hypothetical protein